MAKRHANATLVSRFLALWHGDRWQLLLSLAKAKAAAAAAMRALAQNETSSKVCEQLIRVEQQLPAIVAVVLLLISSIFDRLQHRNANR